MGKVIVDETNLARIAQAIRVKRGTEEQMFPSEMASAILSISTVRPSGTVNIQSNGIHNVTDYSQAVVNVPNSYTAEDDSKVVVEGALVSQSALSITADGNYDTTAVKNVMVSVSHMTESLVASQNGVYTASLYAYSRVVVNVSAPEPTLESISVTSNGIYEPSEGVDGFSGVVVNVPSGTDTADATLSDGAQMRSGITAYASGSKYTGTMPDYSGSVNSGTGSIGSYGVYSGGYFIAPSTSDIVVPTRHKVFLSDLTIASYSASSAVVNLQDILIESNGTYVADAGYDGFGNVVVDIEGGGGSAVLSEGYFTSAGEYHASDVDADGWSTVTIDMPEKVLGSVTLSANGVYEPSDVDAWSRVTVDVAGASLGSVVLSANGTYSASAVGLDGFDEVTVSIPTNLDEITVFNDGEYHASSLGTAGWSVIRVQVASGYNYSYIASRAFISDSTIFSVNFPNVSTIGNNAFEDCINLSVASFPICESIGNYAFDGCSNLQQVDIPNCETIGSCVFEGCNLASVSAPVVSVIGNWAFEHNSNLSYVSIPICEIIGTGAFKSCSALELIDCSLCSSIGADAFEDCTSLSFVNFPICETIGAGAFENCLISTAIFPSCTEIRASAFYGNSALSVISFPICQTIGSNAFYGCSSITEAVFPSCTSIGSSVFDGCENLSNISMPMLLSMPDPLGSMSNLQTLSIDVCSVIGNVRNKTQLKTVYAPLCQSIASSAFYGCITLSSINVSSCKWIGGSAFRNCSALTSISLPMCEFIGKDAFENCGISLITLPMLKSAGENAFTKNFTDVYLLSSRKVSATSCPLERREPTLGDGWGNLYVPASLYNSYNNDSVWNSRFGVYTGGWSLHSV